MRNERWSVLLSMAGWALAGAASIGLLLGPAACNFNIATPNLNDNDGGDGDGNENDNIVNDNGDGDNVNGNDNDEPEAPPIFGGEASLVNGNVSGVEFSFVSTGELPEEGGALEESLLEVVVQNTLTAEVARASVIGQGLSTEAEASIASLFITVDDNTIELDLLTATAVAECVDGEPVLSSDFEIVELVVNGDTLTVTTEPNQTFTIVNEAGEDVGRITVNEQVSSVEGNTGEIEVNALRVEIFGSADITVIHARASIECPVEEPTPVVIGDFITGGGFIETGDSFANFGVAGGIMDDELFGHLLYIDHGTDLKVKGTSVTAYEVVNETTRRIEGTCEVNQVGGFTFEVVVADNGEPGINDTFSISLSNGYSASGTLIGGNIQLHEEVVPAGE